MYSFEYDMLNRTSNGILVDSLAYTYSGNQLKKLTENIIKHQDNDIYISNGILKGEYCYDKNGNMINDSRRALDLSYNVLNLLNEVKTTSGTLKAKYIYLADGTKLRVQDSEGVNRFDYLGSLKYRKIVHGYNLNRQIPTMA